MNAIYFVFVAAILAFATGFFVAAIIWSISWFLKPHKERVVLSGSTHLLHIFTKKDLNRVHPTLQIRKESGFDNFDSCSNMELYHYYHGKN